MALILMSRNKCNNLDYWEGVNNMVGLLGMLAAGGAMGARDASNASVRAQNELEISNAREMMREEFLNRRFDKELELGKIKAKSDIDRDKIKYENERIDKEAQREHEIKKVGLLGQNRLDVEDRRNAGANARLEKRIAADKDKNPPKPKIDENDLYVTLKDGRKYLPQTNMEKEARGLFIGGIAPSYEDALRGLQTGKFLSPALSVPGTFTSKKAVDTARNISGQLYGNEGIQRFKLEDLVK